MKANLIPQFTCLRTWLLALTLWQGISAFTPFQAPKRVQAPRFRSAASMPPQPGMFRSGPEKWEVEETADDEAA
jgi:hypothetical protein